MVSKARRFGDISDIPEKVWRKAWLQWLALASFRLFAIVAGLAMVPVAIMLSKEQCAHQFGEPAEPFMPYPDANPNGWVFYSVPLVWRDGNMLKRFVWLFCNDEDGFYGDMRGWWSSDQKGKERSFASMFKWAALRNPANNLSRYTKAFTCLVNECSIAYFGDYDSPDNRPVIIGAHFVIATDADGRKYYGFREVTSNESKTWGFKLKPRYADEFQSPDDANKGFTLRTNPL